MEVFFLSGYVILIVFALIFIKSRLNKIPLILYLIWWGILYAISMANPYDLYPLSNSTYTLLFLNTLMFFIGYLIISYKKKDYRLNLDNNFYKLNRILLVTQIIILPILIYYNVKYQMLLNTLGHTYARTIKYDLGLLFNSVFESAFYSYILQPVLLVISILTAIKFIKKDIKNLTFILMLLNVVLNTRIGLGRFGYFELIAFILIIYFLIKIRNKHKFTINKHKLGQKVIIAISGFFFITLMNYTLLIRKGFEEVSIDSIMEGYILLFEQGVSYFVGPFRAFDYLIHNDLFNEYFYGRLTFGGVDHIFGMFFKLIDSNYITAYQSINPIIQDPIYIGDGKTFNAFYTSLMNHYLDLNIIGILIFPLLYGMVTAYVVNLFVKNQNIGSLSLVVFVVYNAILSSLNWSYQNVSTWVALGLLIILYIYFKKLMFKFNEVSN